MHGAERCGPPARTEGEGVGSPARAEGQRTVPTPTVCSVGPDPLRMYASYHKLRCQLAEIQSQIKQRLGELDIGFGHAPSGAKCRRPQLAMLYGMLCVLD